MKRLILTVLVIATIGAVGCNGSKEETPGYTKKDFARTPPPAGYLGNVPKAPTAPSGSGGTTATR